MGLGDRTLAFQAYNGALTAFKAGELENTHQQVGEALERFPEHASSQELLSLVESLFAL